MAEFGELCLWAAAPLAALAVAASVAGGWTGRGDLAVLGGRAAQATALLTLLTVAGLGHALVAVKLKYIYVAAFSGFQHPWPWRLAALWSAPAGGALLLTFLMAALAALSYRLNDTRMGTVRTGMLAALVLLALLVVARTQPFAQLAVPALAGEGLPVEVKGAPWQVATWATYLAVACAASAFAGGVGGQPAEPQREGRRERGGVNLAAGLLTAAVLATAWRAYATEGRLLGDQFSSVAVFVPAWLIACSYLHAPGGAAAPAWAVRWRRIMGVALFPAALGAAASLLAGMGTEPPAVPWAAGLAVGVVSGALAGLAPQRAVAGGAERVPGFGPFALLGALLTLALAGVAALWGLLRGSLWLYVAWPAALIGLGGIAVWSVQRPAGRWTRVWLLAGALAVAGALAAYGLSGWRAPGFAVAGGLAAGVLAGFAADLVRLRAASRALAGADPGPASAVMRTRARRRRASALAHLGVALVALGLSANALTRTATRTLEPGASLSLPGRLGAGIQITYLGLSRYRVGELERQVASFRLNLGDAPAELISAALTNDWSRGRQFQTPAVEQGLVRDVIVGFRPRRGSEAVNCHLSARFLAGLVWLGGALVLLAFVLRGRPLP